MADKDTTLAEAAHLKAEHGDPYAIALDRHLRSCEFRVAGALFEAAAEKHPHWVNNGDHSYSYRNPDNPDEDLSDKALIDWFQRTYPHEAPRPRLPEQGGE